LLQLSPVHLDESRRAVLSFGGDRRLIEQILDQRPITIKRRIAAGSAKDGKKLIKPGINY
jgi:hypothetical protein